MQDGEPIFQSPAASPRWEGLPDLEDAGPRAVLAYLAAYGPATRDNLHYWLNAGLSAGRRRLDGWIDGLTDDRITEVSVDASPMLHPREHLAALSASEPELHDVILLPGHDQWVLGPGTADQGVVPTKRPQAVTRGANLLLLNGQVAGTWTTGQEVLAVSWFAEGGTPPRRQIDTESQRLAGLLDRDLTLTISVS